MTTHRGRFWHLARALVKAQYVHLRHNNIQVFTRGVSRPFSSCSAPGISVSSYFFGSSHIGSFHSPVHDGRVDVDEIDEDLKVEVALGDDDEDDRLRLVATK